MIMINLYTVARDYNSNLHLFFNNFSGFDFTKLRNFINSKIYGFDLFLKTIGIAFPLCVNDFEKLISKIVELEKNNSYLMNTDYLNKMYLKEHDDFLEYAVKNHLILFTDSNNTENHIVKRYSFSSDLLANYVIRHYVATDLLLTYIPLVFGSLTVKDFTESNALLVQN